MTKQHAAVVCVVLLLSGTVHAGDGELLFKSRCQQCHQTGATALKSPSDAINQILASGSIRKHRFSLSAAEIETVTAYIATIRGQ